MLNHLRRRTQLDLYIFKFAHGPRGPEKVDVMQTYSEYENALFLAIIEAEAYGAAGANSKGQVDVFEAAREAGLDLKENWARDAVRSFEDCGWVWNVVRPIGPSTIFLMVTSEGRKEAERRQRK
jgi:hypothetical protein